MFHFFKTQSPSPEISEKARWSIGIYSGESPITLSCHPKVFNPILTANDVTDIPAAFVADPFMIKEGSMWYMFFEALHGDLNLGKIGLATSVDGLTWQYDKIVMSEPYSLSYPFVFKTDTDYFMIPECNSTKSIRLYRSDNFPYSWTLESVLLKGQRFSDTTVFRYQDFWWMFTATRSRPINNGRLRLYYSNKLKGPWIEHPKSPVVDNNPSIARPAGRVIVTKNNIIRFAQDDFPIYGNKVWAFNITQLSPDNYDEKPAKDSPVVQATGTGWNQYGMHTVDAHWINGQWIACVDGLGDA